MACSAEEPFADGFFAARFPPVLADDFAPCPAGVFAACPGAGFAADLDLAVDLEPGDEEERGLHGDVVGHV
ncbi:hypothetical protein, partial [Streptomyces geysiriensis]|uniref:hypothetical protein n=1 Tax=Streptomyces geysiriensis TaxID=68207 RepID=UPI0027E1001D